MGPRASLPRYSHPEILEGPRRHARAFNRLGRRRRRSFEVASEPLSRFGAGACRPRGARFPGDRSPPDARDVRRRRRAVPLGPRRLDDVALQDLLRKRDGLPRGRPGTRERPDLHNFLDQLMRDGRSGRRRPPRRRPGRLGRRSLSSSFFREIGDLGIPRGNRLPPPARGGSLAAAPSAAPQPKPKAHDAPRARATTRSAVESA